MVFGARQQITGRPFFQITSHFRGALSRIRSNKKAVSCYLGLISCHLGCNMFCLIFEQVNFRS